MADDRHYVPGDFYRICERTGFKVRSRHTAKEWTGHIVRSGSWEPRHSQDFVRGVRDDQTVPEARPRQTDVFIGPLGTTLAADHAALVTTLTVTLSTRMMPTDTLNIMLDDGTVFYATIVSVLSPTAILITPGLPSKASKGNRVVDITAYAKPSIG